MKKDPRSRFSDRVSNYVRYRPSYPQAAVDRLIQEFPEPSTVEVADIGSGPGNFSKLLLPFVKCVYGVEPNDPMREAAESELAAFDNFISVSGSAENTGLASKSVSLIAAAQAFHWFETARTKAEFARILADGGAVALIWNRRLSGASEFSSRYEDLLECAAPEYRDSSHRNITLEQLAEFFSPANFEKATFPYAQYFDLQGLVGRALSSSYMPLEGPQNEELVSALEKLFSDTESEGKVVFEYETELYWGHLA